MRTRTRVTKDAAGSTTKDSTVFRLTDMTVEEVSAVDAAANKRKFVVTKAAGPEVVATPSGELTVTKDVPPATSTQPPASEPMPSSPEAPPIPSATNTVEEPNGTILRMSAEMKADLSSRVTVAEEALAKMKAALASAEEVQGLGEVPQAILDSVSGVVAALETGVTKFAVEKGRKQISMARESKIRAAKKELDELVAELDEATPTPTEEPAPAPAPEAAPSTAPAATPATKSGEMVESPAAVIERLVKTVDKLSAANAKQSARLAKYEGTRPASNAVVVESTDVNKNAKPDGEPVAWPRDMNSPTTIGSDE